MKNMKKNPKQNRESSLMRSPLILGLSIVLCIPVAYSHAKSSNIVKNESVQSIPCKDVPSKVKLLMRTMNL